MTVFIGIVGNKGGISKTALARNLADGCAREKLRTIVIDADSQHTLTMTMQVQPVDALKTLLEDDTVDWSDLLCEVPEAFTGEKRDYFYILPTYEGQTQIESMPGLPDRIYERFQELTGFVDVVIIDTSPGRSNIHAGVYQICDGYFLPCQCELESILGIGATLNHLFTVSQTAPVGKVMGIVPVLFDASVTIHQTNYSWLLEHYKRYPIFKPIHEMAVWKDAAQKRQSLYTLAESKNYYQRRKARVAIAEMQPILDTILKAVRG